MNPRSGGEESRLYTMEPYQANQIPILFVHGLLSDPFTWADMVNELKAHPGLVEHFQIWVYEYPTGESFFKSAAELRQQLAMAQRQFDPHGRDAQLSDMVVVGHSMGGLISKLQVTSSGDRLWQSVANRPLDQIHMDENLRRDISAAFYFRPSPLVSRVVFIGTPHRGAAAATRLIGRISSSLVNEPPDEQQRYDRLIQSNPGVFSDEVSRGIPTSIDLLEPESKLLQTIEKLPVNKRVRFHSIIGDCCWTLCNGKSDGVVPVTSAREPRAISERIVKARHTGLNSNPDSIEEILLILEEHLRQSCQRTVRPVALRMSQ